LSLRAHGPVVDVDHGCEELLTEKASSIYHIEIQPAKASYRENAGEIIAAWMV
jgi:hypothetical protein